MIALLSLAALASPASTFRGLAFGGPCPTGPEWSMAEEDTTQQVQAWTRAGEKLSIGDASLTSVAYFCWTGGGASPVLSSVMVGFPEADGPAMKLVLTEQWGKPVQSNQYIDRYIWLGPPVSGCLDYEHKGLLLLLDREVEAKMAAAKKARAAAAGGDL